MTPARRPIDQRTFLGAILLGFAFGSLHAFGVLLEPLERQWGFDRSIASSGYSIAIVTLTLGVFLSKNIAGHFSPRRLALAIGTLGALGVSIAASGSGVFTFLFGYGVMFGFSNGMAYRLFLERAAAAMPRAKGLAIGIVTGAYGLGAVFFTQSLGAIANDHSAGVALRTMAFSIVIAGLGSAFVFTPTRISAGDPLHAQNQIRVGSGRLVRLWLVYFLGTCGGLMVIAHAAAIMSDIGASTEVARYGATLNAVGNVIGSALGGLWADRTGSRRALAAPLLISLAAMSALLWLEPGWSALAMFSLCGFSYGALIVVVPVVIQKEYGAINFGKAFGFVFTSWGAAGLAGPLIAAVLYDFQGGYKPAISAAIACAVLALILNAAPNRLCFGTEPGPRPKAPL